MMLYPEFQAFPEIGEEEFQDGSERTRGEDVQVPGAAEHPHCGKQAENAEKMVPVNVRDADCVDCLD